LFVLDDIVPRIHSRDDFRRRKELRVPAAVIGMMMRRHHVLDWLAGDALDFAYDALVIAVELVVDQDDAVARDIRRDITPVTLDLEEVVFHFIHCQLRGLVLSLRVGKPSQREEKEPCGSACGDYPVHSENYTRFSLNLNRV